MGKNEEEESIQKKNLNWDQAEMYKYATEILYGKKEEKKSVLNAKPLREDNSKPLTGEIHWKNLFHEDDSIEFRSQFRAISEVFGR